jgi:hypothetical protein
MDRTEALWILGAKAIAVVALSAWSAAAAAQLPGSITEPLIAPPPAPTPAGQAAVVRSTVAGVTTSLADTGTLSDAGDARNASLLAGSVPSVLGAEVLQAAAIGWSDQAASEASLANLAMSVAGLVFSADFIMASATAAAGSAASGTSLVENLSVNGALVAVSGSPNQVIDIPGGRVVINEQSASAGGISVNALHVIVDGVADVVVGSATAALQ